MFLIITIFIVVAIFLWYLCVRNNKVCEFRCYIYELNFLNAIYDIHYSNTSYNIEKRLKIEMPSYEAMLYSFKPLDSYIKIPEGIYGYLKPLEIKEELIKIGNDDTSMQRGISESILEVEKWLEKNLR